MSEKRLLVVDDEPEFGELVRKVAVGLGYEARVATSGHEFQDAYREMNPTMIVMDMVMPEMSGREVFERIRRLREDFLRLTDVIGQSYTGVDPAIAETEIDAAVAQARKAARNRPRRRR